MTRPTVAAPSFPNAGQNTLSQAFAASLAQSASTVSTAPAHSTFAAPVATPLSPGQYKVPKIVLAAYNNPLTGKSPASTTVTPGQTLNVLPFSTNRQLNVPPGQIILVKFSNGSSRLNARGRAQIRKAAKAYKAKGKGFVRVVGHASHRTRDMAIAKHRMANFSVSLDRANVVARELMRQGIKASALRVEAKSDSDPVFFEYMPAGEAQNRRTEIFLGF
jgi:outer membrane protein OmpA-like peptidoglycan-associated protein